MFKILVVEDDHELNRTGCIFLKLKFESNINVNCIK